jgi:hypothetical protein
MQKIFKNKKFMASIGALVFMGAFHQIKFSRIHIKDVPMLMSSMRAKEFCSCYFILGKDQSYCLDSVKKGYPLFDYQIDDVNQLVTFTNPVASASAGVTNFKYGCELK